MFEDLHISAKKAKRSFLTIEEIKVWKNFRFAGEEKHLERDRDIFMLQIYTGYYYKDIINLKKEHLVKDHQHGYMILGNRTKNDEQTMIPLFKFPEAASLIEKYASKRITDEYVFDRKAFLSEGVYNRQLKQVARKMGINKPFRTRWPGTPMPSFGSALELTAQLCPGCWGIQRRRLQKLIITSTLMRLLMGQIILILRR